MHQEEKRSLHVKLRKAVLGERLRQEQPPKDASTQTTATTATAAASPAKTPATPRQRSAQHASSETAPSAVQHSFQHSLLFHISFMGQTGYNSSGWSPFG